MSLKELLREANGPEAYEELARVRREREYSTYELELMERIEKADHNGDGVLDPDDSLELHHGNIPEQRNPKDEK